MHAERIVAKISREMRSKHDLTADDEITFVGVHNRRTDYLSFRKRRLGLDNLREDYFEVRYILYIVCGLHKTEQTYN